MTDDATQEREAVSELERLSHTHGPIVVDWMGEQLGWCPLSEVDGGSWATFSQAQTDALKIPREPTVAMLIAGDKAWSRGTLTLAIWQAMWDAALEQSK
jgi:hypothetical protein